jgi:hypothetical protein
VCGACTLQLANLLGYEHPKQLIKTDFTRFLAQPFMQLHARWMRVSGVQSGSSWTTTLSKNCSRCC